MTVEKEVISAIIIAYSGFPNKRAGHVYLFFSNFPLCTALLGPAHLFFWTKIPPARLLGTVFLLWYAYLFFQIFPPARPYFHLPNKRCGPNKRLNAHIFMNSLATRS